MLNAHIDYGFDVIVVQGIEYRLANLAVLDQPCVFQYSELVRDCRHTHRKLFGDVANAHLALEKQVEYLYARAVAHNREKFGKIKEMLVVGQGYAVDYISVCFVLAARRRRRVIMIHYILFSFHLND